MVSLAVFIAIYPVFPGDKRLISNTWNISRHSWKK